MAEDLGFNFIDKGTSATSGTPGPVTTEDIAKEQDENRKRQMERQRQIQDHLAKMAAIKAEQDRLRKKFEDMPPTEKQQLGLTEEVRQEIIRSAETPEAVHIEAFMDEFGIDMLDLDEVFTRGNSPRKDLAPGTRTDLELI